MAINTKKNTARHAIKICSVRESRSSLLAGLAVVGVRVVITELLVDWDLEGVLVAVFPLVTWDEIMVVLCSAFVLMAELFIAMDLMIVLWLATGLTAVLRLVTAIEVWSWAVIELDDKLFSAEETLSFEETPNTEDDVTRYLDEGTCGEWDWFDGVCDAICVVPWILLVATLSKGETEFWIVLQTGLGSTAVLSSHPLDVWFSLSGHSNR